MTPAEFRYLARYLKRRSGLSLGADKMALASSSLMPLARRRGHADVGALIRELMSGRLGLGRAIVAAMGTHETRFFRDEAVYEQFREAIFPVLLHARLAERRIRIWCAAASTGQEPYSLAMIVEEFRSVLDGWTIDILGTDINVEVVERARRGIYSDYEVRRGLPAQMLTRHFKADGGGWRLDDVIRNRVQFGAFNLLDGFGDLGVFDLVLCRNVLLYFDMPTKKDVLKRFHGTVADDGYLVLGSAETILGCDAPFERRADADGIYAKVPVARALGLARA